MGDHTLEFWFEFASTYSYPAAERMAAVVEAGAARVVYRPFLLGPIFKAQGWSDSPFNLYPAKGRHMWRDLERRCEQLGLPLRRPSAFPRNGLRAARLCIALAEHEALPRVTSGIYRANFALDQDVADPEVLAQVLRDVGLDPGHWLEAAGGDGPRAALREQAARAQALGLFGAPSFRVDGELFWGEDRLQQALAHAAVPTAVAGVVVRPFRMADYDAVLALWQATGIVVPGSDVGLDLRSKFATQPEHFLLALRAGRVVGTCMGGFEGRRGWLNALSVAEDARGQGLGRALVAAAEARLRACGCPKVDLQVRAGNAGAVAFYAGLGYAVEDHTSMGKRLIPVGTPAPHG